MGLRTFKNVKLPAFLKHSSYLIGGSVVAQGLNFLGYPFITHVISPVDFGCFAFLLSFVNMIAIFAFGRMELLFPVKPSRVYRVRLLQACLLFFSVILVLAISGSYFFSRVILQIAQMPEIPFWFVSIASTLIVTSLVNLFSSYQVAVGGFKLLSFSRILQVLLFIGITLVVSKSQTGFIALVIGYNLSNATNILISAADVFLFRRDRGAVFSLRKSILIMRKHKKMIFINGPHAIIDAVQNNLVNLVIGRFYSVEAIGLYALANRLVKASATTVGTVISQVYYNRIGPLKDRNAIFKFSTKVLGLLCAFSAVFILTVFFGTQYFFTPLFGTAWIGSKGLILVLLPWVAMNLIASPFSLLPIVLNRQGSAMVFGIFYNSLIVIMLFVMGILGFDLVTNIFAVSLAAGAANIGYLFFVFRMINHTKKEKVIVLGLPYFAKKIANDLSASDLKTEYVALDTSGKIWDQVRYVWNLPFSKTVYLIGGTTQAGRALKLALFFNKKIVMHWVGTDVLKAQESFRAGAIDTELMSRTKSLCEVHWIQTELKAIGISAEIAPIASFDLDKKNLKQLPREFSVLSYVGKGREEFYGIRKIAALAETFPEIPFRLAGTDTSPIALPANVELLGWIENMDKEYENSVLYLRLTEHDGLSFSVLEALASGRYVGYSQDCEPAHFVPTFEELNEYVRDLSEQHRSGKLPTNQIGADFIFGTFNREQIMRRLAAHLGSDL